jgi:hypothetical protein
MNKEKFTEQAYLYLMDELEENERIEFEDILLQDDRLKNEFDEMKLTGMAIQSSKPSEVDNRLLASARQNLMREIRKEAELVPPITNMTNSIRRFLFENYRLAFGGIATFAFGIVIGYILLVPKFSHNQSNSNTPITGNEVQIEKDNTQISNIQLEDSGTKNGEVAVTFDAVKPVKVTGQPTDPFIKKLLIASLLNESNPGVRLRSVNTIAQEVNKNNFKPDSKIKDALISAMKTDGNPAVRREALGALIKYPFDEKIRDAFLYVLSNDRNSGMRVASINALADLKQRGEVLDDQIKNVLNKKAENDNNNFVRIRAASILQEVR